MTGPGRNHRLLTFVMLFLTAFTIRLGFVLVTGAYLVNLDIEMTRAAATLVQEGTLGNVYAADTGPSAHVAPLYAGLLALLYRIFGVATPPGLLAQAVLAITFTSACIAVLPLLAERARLSPTAGLVAAAVMAVMPFNFFAETSGYWEQPLVTAALMGLFAGFLVLHDRQWQGWRWVPLLGFCVGLGALLSPVLLPPTGLMMAAEFGSQRDRRWRVLLISVAVLGLAALVCVPWVYRNYVVLGGFVPLRSNGGLELFIGNNDHANGQSLGIAGTADNAFLVQHHPSASKAEQATIKEIGELAYMNEKARLGKEWIRDHPWQFLGLTVTRFRLYWFPQSEMWTAETSARLFKSCLFSGFSVAAFVCLAYLFWVRHPYRWLLAATLIGPCLPYLITHVDLRYRYPTFWLSVLLSAECLVCLTRHLWRHQSDRTKEPMTETRPS
jgi:hypothetical protein